MIYVFLAEGFEEIEALGTVDILKRAGIEAYTVSVTESKSVIGAHGISINCDKIYTEAVTLPEMIILPGGMPGTLNLEASPYVCEMLKKQNECGGYISAICAAPSVLGKLGLIDDITAVCYPSFEKFLPKHDKKKRVYRDGNFITAIGPGAFFEFSYEIIKLLIDEETAEKVKASGLFI